jgi:putative Mg2+ transporter-C (MgtC) family protein
MFFDPVLIMGYDLTVFIKISLAALAGGVIGLERERHGRPAGLRTHLLVAVGACLMIIISEAFYLKYNYLDVDSVVRLDPGRVAAQIVTGIGFLGAGVILKEGITVRGLTTAASLWVVAGIGMSFGIGLFIPAIFATVLALFSLVVLKRLDPWIVKDRYLHLTVVAADRKDIFPELEKIFAERQLRISNVESELNLLGEEVRYDFTLSQHKRKMGRELTAAIAGLEGVKKIRYK